jgi:hypothetical protein
MKKLRFLALGPVMIVVLWLAPCATASQTSATRLPFVTNEGQTDARVAFTADTFGGTVFITHDGEIVYALRVGDASVVLKERLAGSGALDVHGLTAGAAQLLRFVGSQSGSWQRDITTYDCIAFGSPWPGIDFHLRAASNNVEKIFTIAAYADSRQISLRLDGARSLRVDADGALVADTLRGNVRFSAPIAWQGEGSTRRSVPVSYSLSENGYGFVLGKYDRTRPVTIDPSLVYSTYLGGSASDGGVGITVDSSGSAYITGITFSNNFPLAAAWDGTHDLQNDIFVTKLTPDGSGLVFSTFLGGSSFEDGRGITLDAGGNIWITGVTFSTDFPTPGSTSSAGGNGDAYVARLDSNGALTFARYLGGTNHDEGKTIALDGAGNVLVFGSTKSTNFPTLSSAIQPVLGGGVDAFIAKLDAGSPDTLLYSSYLGGNGDDCAFFLGCELAVDPSGDVLMVMDTTSTNLPVPNHITTPFNGGIYHGGATSGFGGDGWIGRLNLSTNALRYGSYIGGSGWDEPYALVRDSTGDVWVVGDTGSSDFPTLHALVGPGSYNGAVAHGVSDGFAMRLSWNGGASPLAVVFSTYLGGSGTEHVGGVRINAAGDAWVGGSTTSTDLPTANALQTINRGKQDAFVARLSWNGTALSLPFATYLGGSDDDTIVSIALGPAGDLFFTGNTKSIDYPIARPFQASAIGAGDAVVGRITTTVPPPALFSENGYTITPHGTLRVLLLFAEVDYSDPNCAGLNTYPNASALWPAGSLPLDADNYFDHFLPPGSQPQGYLTKYYYQGSLGQYVVLGDYYPHLISVPCSQVSWSGHNAVISQLNSLGLPLQTKHVNPMTGSPYGLDDFDLWGNEGPGLPKSNFPNGVVDAILIIWRNNHNWCGACGYGLQSLGGNAPLQTKTVDQMGSYDGYDSSEPAFSITISEYFHALFGGNNWHTGSGAGSHTFPFVAVGSYGTTQGQVSNTVAGYDRYHMGWKNPQKQFLLSALDTSGSEVPSDISVQSDPFGATFVLRDYYSTGDAVRIKLPHFNWQAAGDVKNQYLWLENHQRSLLFDRSRMEAAPGKEPWAKGLYVQLQVGKDQKSGPDLYAWADNLPNALASWLLQYTAEGNYDYMYRFDQAQAPSWATCNWMNANIPTDLAQSLPNPFTGFSDVYRLIDSADTVAGLSTTAPTLRPLSNGVLLSQDRVQTQLTKMVGSTPFADCDGFGDSEDAFNSANSHNLSLGIGTNPAAVPAYTLRSLYGFSGPQNIVAGYENRKIRLNNLLVEITGENVDGNGAMSVKVSWDRPRINDNVRWTGDIDLQNDPLDPQSRTMQMELAAGKQICLDRGFSATKDLANSTDGLFTDPTLLTLHAGTVTHLESNARMDVANGSQLAVEPGAILNLDAGASIAFTPQPPAGQWAPCNQSPCTPAPPGMVAWWSMDETSGSSSADSTGGNHGTRVNNPTPDAGVVRGGLRFLLNWSNPQHIRVPHAGALNFGSGSFTFDAWLKPSGPGVVLSKHDDNVNRGYEVFLDLIVGGSSPMVPVGMRVNGNFYHPSSCSISSNQWTHVTLVTDRGTTPQIRCYLGGILAGSSPLNAIGSTDNTNDLFIGNAAQFGGLGPYDGVIDEVELFNRALSPATVTAIVASGAGGKCHDGCTKRPAGLDAWWPLDEATGNQAYDIVSGADGTLSGAVHLPAGFSLGALTFDGTAAFVEVPNNGAVDVAQGDFTIDAWVRKPQASPPGVGVLFDKRAQISGGATQGWSLFLVNGRVGVQLADGVGNSMCSSTPGVSSCTNFISNTTVDDGAWHFVAASVRRNSPVGGSIFVDGSRVFTFDPTIRSGSLSNGAPLRFGKRSFDDSGYFGGNLDEVEVFHRSLTDGELGAIYAAGAGGKCKASIDTPISVPVCPPDSFVDVPITICNDSASSHSYFYSLHGLPGGDPITGVGCNLPGPTSFTYLNAAPVTVPAMSCLTVTIRVARPPGMTAQNKTSCYEAVGWDTATGIRFRDTGVLRAKFSFCPMMIGSSNFEISRLAPASRAFGILNTTVSPQLYQWRVEGAPAGTVQFADMRPGQNLRGEVKVAAGATARIDFAVRAPSPSPGTTGEYRIYLNPAGVGEPDAQPVESVSFRIASRNNAPQPPDVAIDVIGSGPLRAGERATYWVQLRNVGARPPAAKATVTIDLPPGVDLIEIAGSGFLCRNPTSAAAGMTVACVADSQALAPGAAMSLRLTVLPGFRPEQVMKVCARAGVPGEIQLVDNVGCMQRDYQMPNRSADLGDAPDSSNHFGRPEDADEHEHHDETPPPGVVVPPDSVMEEHHHSDFNFVMYAYENVVAHFPTVFEPELGDVQGPIHWQPRSAFWLGRDVSDEYDADIEPDEDHRTNIDPVTNGADRDEKDDGLVAASLRLPDCAVTTFDVVVTLKEPSARPLLNVWFDFNRDGDWGDNLTCNSNGRVLNIGEWAVRNQRLTLKPGTNTIHTTSFAATGAPTAKQRMWMRITLSDAPAPEAGDGRGPATGYRFGETEDYLLPLQTRR